MDYHQGFCLMLGSEVRKRKQENMVARPWVKRLISHVGSNTDWRFQREHIDHFAFVLLGNCISLSRILDLLQGNKNYITDF